MNEKEETVNDLQVVYLKAILNKLFLKVFRSSLVLAELFVPIFC